MPTRRSLIGRDAEFAALAASIDADRSTLVIGEAGIGKTAIVRAAVGASDRAMQEGGAFATLREAPYLALSRAVGASLAGDPAAVAARVEALVGPDVLFVDDAQWADEQTLAALELLAGRILVLSAIRALDPGAARASERLQAAGSAINELQPLPDAAARSLVAARRPALSSAVVADIVRRAAGNPLLLEEMADHGGASPVLARVLTGRLDALTADTRAAVELLAIADRPLPRGLLGAAADEAIRAGIARERPPGIEIRHQLVGDAVRDGLDSERRRALHGRVAELLGDGPEVAGHLAAAGRGSEARDVALAALSSSRDPHDRAALLVITAEASPPEEGLQRRLEAAVALDEVADWAAVTSVLGGVVRGAAGDSVETEALAEAHALLAHAAFYLGEVEAARRHVEQMSALGVRSASPAAVRCAIEAATFLVNVEGAVPEAIARLDAAMAELPPDDPAITDLAVLKVSILMLAIGAGDLEMIRAAADRAFDAGRFRTATDRARVVQYLLLMSVGSDAALAFLLERDARYQAAGMQSMAADFLADAVVAAVLAGRLTEAVTIADRLLETPASLRARQAAEIHRARALVMLGRIDEGERALQALRRAVSSDYFGLAETLHNLAEAALYGGRPRDALALADAALAVTSPLPGGRVPHLITRAWARFELGLPPEVDVGDQLARSVVAAKDEVAGIHALAAGANREAAAAFEAAAGTWVGFMEPRAVVCRWAAGESLRRGGDAEGAANQLGEALRTAEAIGFEPIAARARRSLRLLGVRIATRSGGAAAHPLGLTVRERELVALVERGLTNVEIARRLGLGRPTVARILTSAMMKLGVGSRAQLAATGSGP